MEVRGDVPRGGPWLAVSNHLGYLDVPALASVLPVSFVSKSEVRRWPLIGFLAAAGGTIFVDREDRIAAPDFIRRVRSRLSAGGNVLLFPEGTSSRGETVLPFHSSPFASADEPGTRLLPLAVELLEVDGKRASGGVRDLACWHGDMTFAGHFFRFLALRGARFRVTIGPPFDCRSLDRKEAAAFTRSQVLGLMSAGKFTNP
ncbi:MAG: 1-acyl-sn-glycerol-3-phosphate acyltransferase [Deltaproteobacteria bacterium]|nr:1-acyl-sn-glycerol-3-phosphate acyltransferase [Deltaproteobacteria bacterium]